MNTPAATKPNAPEERERLCVLAVLPGKPQDANSMPFLRRQLSSLAEEGVDVRPFFLESRVSPAAIARQWRELRAALREEQPDVVHAHFGTVTALFTALATTKPLLITYRGSDLNPTPAVSWLRNTLAKLFSQLASLRARRIICVSDQLRRRLWWRKRDIAVLSDGINLELFKPYDKAEARRQLGWNRDKEILLFTARNDPIGKGLDLAEAAAEYAGKRRPGVHLEVLRGKTPSEQMPLLYSAADCLLMCSRFEGSPNVVKEAMACNCPVVSVDVGDVRERLDGVTPSRLVERDGAAMGAAICEILEAQSRSNGRQHILPLGESEIAKQIVQIYREAA